MKYTLFLTQRCNLACDYCYVGKRESHMPLDIAKRAIDFAYSHTPQDEDVDIGFFGGEPLLEYPLLVPLTNIIKSDTRYDPCRVKLGLTTNGTLLTAEMVRFFQDNGIASTISCDGPPAMQDRFRHYADGSKTSPLVEEAIRLSVAIRGGNDTSVNAVFGPYNIEHLTDVVDYFSSLGVLQITLSADYGAHWTEADLAKIPASYGSLAKRYVNYYREGRPHYISLVDSRITVMLRGGYQPKEKCRMGTGEFAFTPSGRVLPCERLAATDPELHSIGTINGLVQIGPPRGHLADGPEFHPACLDCSVREYCACWCGCSNYFQTGYYNRPGPFLCMSEKTLLRIAAEVFETLESELGPTFIHHLGYAQPSGDGSDKATGAE